MVTVLYVCVHNAARSQMAEAFTNGLAAQRGADVRAISAGTIAGDRVDPIAAQVMLEAGIPLDRHYPKQLTPEMVATADRVVTMGCGVDAAACPVRFLAADDWGLDDPAGQSIEQVRVIRDQVRERVVALLDTIVSSCGNGQEDARA